MALSWPSSTVKSPSRMRKRRIDSARETARFASSTAAWMAASRSGSSRSDASVASAGLPCAAFHGPSASASSVISAAMYGLPSPTTMAWLIRAWLRSRSSSTAGATFLPPAVTMISFFRPVMVRNPSSSSEPRSPVRNQPSSVEGLLGRLVVVPVAGEDDPAPDQDLALLADLDGHSGQRLADRADLVAVRPVDGGGGRRLGQALPLQHGDAHAAEEMAQPRVSAAPPEMA